MNFGSLNSFWILATWPNVGVLPSSIVRSRPGPHSGSGPGCTACMTWPGATHEQLGQPRVCGHVLCGIRAQSALRWHGCTLGRTIMLPAVRKQRPPVSTSTPRGPWAHGASAQQCLAHQLALDNDCGRERERGSPTLEVAWCWRSAVGGEVGRISRQTCMTGGRLGGRRDKKTRMEWCWWPSPSKGEKRRWHDNGSLEPTHGSWEVVRWPIDGDAAEIEEGSSGGGLPEGKRLASRVDKRHGASLM
jgi:hypothetical protein